MDDILNKINEAYEKGISNPKFKEAIDNIINKDIDKIEKTKKAKTRKKEEIAI